MKIDELISALLKLEYEQGEDVMVMIQLGVTGETLFADSVTLVDGQPTIIAET